MSFEEWYIREFPAFGAYVHREGASPPLQPIVLTHSFEYEWVGKYRLPVMRRFGPFPTKMAAQEEIEREGLNPLQLAWEVEKYPTGRSPIGLETDADAHWYCDRRGQIRVLAGAAPRINVRRSAAHHVQADAFEAMPPTTEPPFTVFAIMRLDTYNGWLWRHDHGSQTAGILRRFDDIYSRYASNEDEEERWIATPSGWTATSLAVSVEGDLKRWRLRLSNGDVTGRPWPDNGGSAPLICGEGNNVLVSEMAIYHRLLDDAEHDAALAAMVDRGREAGLLT